YRWNVLYGCSLAVRAGAVLPEKRQSTLRERGLGISAHLFGLDDPPGPEVSPEEAAQDPLLMSRHRLELERKLDRTEWFEKWLHVVLVSLAKSYSLNLIADGYRVTPWPQRNRSEEELTLYDALNHYLLLDCRWSR